MNQPEQVPQSDKSSTNSIYSDALARHYFPELIRQVKRIETDADKETGEPSNEDEDEEASTAALDKLANQFSLNRPRQSIFSGVAYVIKDNEALDTDEPHFMLDTEVTFEGPEYIEINDAHRVIFALKQTLNNQKAQVEVPTRYGVFLENILRLDYLKESPLSILARYGDDARELVANETFLSARYDEQVTELQLIAVACHGELLPYLDENHAEIACQSYIVRMDAKKSEMPKLTVYNQPNTIITGALSGCMYPDVLNRSKRPFQSTDDFTYGPMPHIAMRDNEAGKTTYIAIDAITAIE